MKANNMRVLFLRSNPILPDPRVEKQAAALSAAGYQVNILGWDRTGKFPSSCSIQDVNIERLQINSKYGRGLANLPQLIQWQIRLLVWLIKHRYEFDLIHACDFDTIIPAWVLKVIFNKHLIYDIFDFYADHLQSTPRVFKSIIRVLDRILINQADAVILVDDVRRAQIYPANPKKLIIVYNTPNNIPPQKKSSYVSNGQFRIAYIGLLQYERGLLELINTVSKHSEWRLDLAGFGGDELEIIDLANAQSNIYFHGRIPYQQTLEISSRADVLVATYDPVNPNHKFASPNKLFEAMMLGKPVIVSDGTNIDQIVQDRHCGLVIPYGDTAALEEAINTLYNNLSLRHTLSKNARQAYNDKYNWGKMKARLLNLYQEFN